MMWGHGQNHPRDHFQNMFQYRIKTMRINFYWFSGTRYILLWVIRYHWFTCGVPKVHSCFLMLCIYSIHILTSKQTVKSGAVEVEVVHAGAEMLNGPSLCESGLMAIWSALQGCKFMVRETSEILPSEYRSCSRHLCLVLKHWTKPIKVNANYLFLHYMD